MKRARRREDDKCRQINCCVGRRISAVDLYRFYVFASVVKHRNVTKAAQELHITQPAVSQHLRLLQQRFGPLLHKNGRGLELTERGQAFYRSIQLILAQVDALEKEYGLEHFSEEAMTLRVGSSYAPATSVLPSLLAAFKKQCSRSDIQLRVSNSPTIQELVRTSELDLAVVTNPAPMESVQMEPFKTFELCFFVSSAHPLASSKTVSVEALARYPLIIGRAKKARSRTAEPVEQHRRKQGEV